jgi:hypothetical protein
MITMVYNEKRKSLVFHDKIWHLTPIVVPLIVFSPIWFEKKKLLTHVSTLLITQKEF